VALSGGKKHFDAKGVPQVVKIRLTPARAKLLAKRKQSKPAAEESSINFRSDALRNKLRKTKSSSISLRKSLTPGTIVILLRGKDAGKKAVLLKQLASGLLLVTGPSTINNVPLIRVKQQYVIATSTKIDVSAVKTDAVDDAFWTKKKESGKRAAPKTEEEYFAPEKGKKEAKKPVDAKRVEIHRSISKEVAAAVGKVPHLGKYLRNRFSLARGVYAHEIKF